MRISPWARIAWACLVALTLGPHGPTALAESKPSEARPQAVAVVNGEPIPWAEFEAALKLRPLPTPLTNAQVRQFQMALVEEMIEDRLVRQFLRRHGPAVDPQEVEQHFRALSESLARQNRTLADFLREIGQTEAQARETWISLIQLSRYVEQQIREDQIRDYYHRNKDYFDRVELSVSHILMRASSGTSPTDRELARRKLEQVREEIRSGRLTFAEAAKKYSQCVSAGRGGDIGTILRKGVMLDEAFYAAAFALTPGDISPVVETEQGYHLILVRQRKPGIPRSFESCYAEVRELFMDEFRVALGKKLRQQAEVKIHLP